MLNSGSLEPQQEGLNSEFAQHLEWLSHYLPAEPMEKVRQFYSKDAPKMRGLIFHFIGCVGVGILLFLVIRFL